ncbi:MAG: SURF1 family cytochrome oxidase biogenesis protein [Nocardioidaceae bacterium]
MYRFLLSGRWLALAALVLVVAGVCVQLGRWQFDRLDERRADNERIEANLATEPVPVEGIAPAGGAVDPDDEWRRVTASGSYDSENQIVLTQQTREVGPGVEVLTPLVVADGQAVLVDRGWIATSGPSDVPSPPAAPTGSVDVTGWLRVDSGAEDWATTPDDGTVRAVDSADIADGLPYEVVPGWISLIEQQPPADAGLAATEEPDLGQGPHFFYGLQWWFFAALALVGYGWFAWTEAHPRRREPVAETRQPASTSSQS